VRHGTLTLFAALNYLEGKLITRLAPRHRHQEWLAFLKTTILLLRRPLPVRAMFGVARCSGISLTSEERRGRPHMARA
jgi:hypothetical protein